MSRSVDIHFPRLAAAHSKWQLGRTRLRKGGSAVIRLWYPAGDTPHCVGVGSPRNNSAIIGLLFGALVLAACGGSDDSESSAVTLPPDAVVESTSTTAEASDTTTTEAPTTTTTTTEPEAPDVTPDEAGAVWESAWQAAADELGLAEVEGFASSDVASGLISAVGSGRSVTNYPAVSPADEDGVWVVHDCLISSPPVIDAASDWYRGEVTLSDSGELIVTDFKLESSSGCVPAVLADEVIADYLEAIAIENEYLTTLTTSEFLSSAVTGNRLEFLGVLRSDLVSNGEEARGLIEAESNPSVFFFISPTEIVIGDCKRLPDDYGIYVTETGERTNGVPPLVPGQRDGHESTLTFIDGRWKIEDTAIVTDAGCDSANTGIAIPVVDVGGERVTEPEDDS